MITTRDPRLVVITQEKALGNEVVRVGLPCFGQGRVFGITYSQCEVQLPTLANEGTAFVLELLRTYPGGLRAEGVVLGKRLASRGKSILIISALSLAATLNCACYWDLAGTIPLDTHLADLRNGLTAPSTEWARLEAAFQSLLGIPPQHPPRAG